MKTPSWLAGALASVWFASAASAQLPSLNDKPWLGYFAVSDSRRCEFKIAALGKTTLAIKNDKGNAMDSSATQILISYGIEEVLPNGKTVFKALQDGSLTSAEKATDKLEKAVIKGKVTDDAAFELTIEQTRGIISMGGRITDPGKLTKNPIRFTVRANIPNLYSYDKKQDKKDLRAFEKKIKGDRIELKWTDGKRLKPDLSTPTDATSPEINGPGISELMLELAGYKGRKLVFSASPNSAIHLFEGKPAPLYEGFYVNWVPDAAKDPDGKARFIIEVK